MVGYFKTTVSILLVVATLGQSSTESPFLLEANITPPDGAEIIVDDISTITVNYTNQYYEQVLLLIETEQEDVIDVLDSDVILNMTSLPAVATFRLKAVQIGFAYLSLMYFHMNHTMVEDGYYPMPLYKVTVNRTEQNLLLQDIFTYLLNVLIVLNNFIMGCKLEFKTIIKCIKKPYGIIIGLCSQFLIMPLLSFAFANAFLLSDIQAVALLTVGCAPGGGVSNMFSVLLEADLDLSVTMTTISLLLAMGLMPLWLIILGPFLSGHTVTVPFENIALVLSLMIVPLGLGMLLQHFRPRWAEKCLLPLKPFALVVVIIALGLGVYQAQYIFGLLTWEITISTLLLPLTGFLLGAVLATVLAQRFKQIKAIALETGVQNTILAITLIKYSYTQPNIDLGMVMPACVSAVTIILLLLLTLVHVLLMKNSTLYRNLHNENSVEEIVSETNDNKGHLVGADGGEPINKEKSDLLSSDYELVEKTPMGIDNIGIRQRGSASCHSIKDDVLVNKASKDITKPTATDGTNVDDSQEGPVSCDNTKHDNVEAKEKDATRNDIQNVIMVLPDSDSRKDCGDTDVKVNHL